MSAPDDYDKSGEGRRIYNKYGGSLFRFTANNHELMVLVGDLLPQEVTGLRIVRASDFQCTWYRTPEVIKCFQKLEGSCDGSDVGPIKLVGHLGQIFSEAGVLYVDRP